MGPFSAKPQPTAQPSGDGGLARACRQALLVPRSSLRIQTEVRHTQENKNRQTGSKQAAGRGFLRPDAGAATSSPTAYHVNIAKLSTSFSNGKTAIISACPAPRLCGEPVMSPLSAKRAGPASSEPSCAHQKSNHVLDGGRHLPKSSPTGDLRPGMGISGWRLADGDQQRSVLGVER